MIRLAKQSGFTLMEILIAVTVGAIVVTVLASAVSNLTDSRGVLLEHGELTQDARFAMERMTRAVRGSRDLLLPLADVPDTDWREHIREQTIPASAPEGSSKFASAVLAVSLSTRIDLNTDGIPDADNDADGLIDEDLPGDTNFDGSPGIHLIDDGGDGVIDNPVQKEDDDEQVGIVNEDPLNGRDDDADGQIDEDPGADMNNDGQPGIAGVDDDGDRLIDEGNSDDDDEDGAVDEDWFDAVVFFISGDDLIERHPVPWDASASDGVTGADFVETVIAARVSRFRVERVAGPGQGNVVDITLELTSEDATVSLNSRVRIGAAP